MSTKYRHPGSKRTNEDPTPAASHAPRAPVERDGPRSPRMMAFREILRCATCGAPSDLALLGALAVDSSCPKCSSDLRTCRNCSHFDPGVRWECRAPLTVRVTSKTARTECAHFGPKRTIEKQTTETRGAAAAGGGSSFPSPSSPLPSFSSRPPSGSPRVSSSSDDARAAFERLFKK